MTAQILHGDCRAVLRTLEGRFRKGVHAYRKPRPHWEREWLVREYIERQRSTGDIAADIGCTDANVLFWLRKHGIPRRSISAARLTKKWGAHGAANPMHGKTGALNPRYVDGSSPERQRMYARTEGREFIRRVYARDDHKCCRCGGPKAGPRSLHVHHVKPWAGNPALRFDETNVVTLCRPCHGFVHSNRNVTREFLA